MPNPNHGHGLSNETITINGSNYYESDDISRVMPGKIVFLLKLMTEEF